MVVSQESIFSKYSFFIIIGRTVGEWAVEDKGEDLKDLETTGRAETDNTGAEEYNALTHDATNRT